MDCMKVLTEGGFYKAVLVCFQVYWLQWWPCFQFLLQVSHCKFFVGSLLDLLCVVLKVYNNWLFIGCFITISICLKFISQYLVFGHWWRFWIYLPISIPIGRLVVPVNTPFVSNLGSHYCVCSMLVSYQKWGCKKYWTNAPIEVEYKGRCYVPSSTSWSGVYSCRCWCWGPWRLTWNWNWWWSNGVFSIYLVAWRSCQI